MSAAELDLSSSLHVRKRGLETVTSRRRNIVMSRLAVVQRSPVLLDRQRTLQGAVAAVAEAAEWINPGDSLVVEPRGKIAAGPLSRESGILYADVDVSRCGVARRSLDVAGHYARPDVFELRVNRRPRDPIAFD